MPPTTHTPAPVRWASAGLVASSWVSAGLFGLYILAFYLGAIPDRLDLWNRNLPRLYEAGDRAALLAMGAHLATGGVILVLGPIQLIDRVRRAAPRLHRVLGRVYVVTSLVAGIGGLVFIAAKGTVGGAAMNVGFGLYGVLMIAAAGAAWRYAWRREFHRHRAWAVRLFALAIGSWLYRMEYGFWFMTVGKVGHTGDFRGAFDMVMAFFFYLPNLAAAELYLRSARPAGSRPVWSVAATAVLMLATLLVAVGTYYFAKLYWIPGIQTGLGGE